MNRPPVRPSMCVLAVCALLFATVGTASVAAGDGPATQEVTAVCDHDNYYPPSLDREWEHPFVDPLENGSLDHWSDGDLARVGGTGDCSLALWDVEDDWDGEWDVRAENATGTADLRLRLDGEVFLDGIAVGLDQESEPTGSDEEPGTTPTDDEFDQSEEDEDTFEYNPGDPDQADRDQGGDGTAVFGVFLVLIGGVNVRFARGMARFSEQLDAIGSKRRWSEVEPAEWKVMLTKISGVVLLVIGVGLLLAGIVG